MVSVYASLNKVNTNTPKILEELQICIKINFIFTLPEVHHGWFSKSSVSLQQFLDIPSRHRARQQAEFRISAPCSWSPADQHDGEDGVVLDDLCHCVKHLRSRTVWGQCKATSHQGSCLKSRSRTLFERCCVPRAYLPVSLMKRILTL